MASAVFGQSARSLVFDLTGWMGMEKRRLNGFKVLSLLISGVGIVIMATAGEGGSFKIGYILLSALAGVLTMTQMVLNSTFAVYKGAIRAAAGLHRGLGRRALFHLLLQRTATIEELLKSPHSPRLSSPGVACRLRRGRHQLCGGRSAVYSALLLSASRS